MLPHTDSNDQKFFENGITPNLPSFGFHISTFLSVLTGRDDTPLLFLQLHLRRAEENDE
jgi:hypothetical protein